MWLSLAGDPEEIHEASSPELSPGPSLTTAMRDISRLTNDLDQDAAVGGIQEDSEVDVLTDSGRKLGVATVMRYGQDLSFHGRVLPPGVAVVARLRIAKSMVQ